MNTGIQVLAGLAADIEPQDDIVKLMALISHLLAADTEYQYIDFANNIKSTFSGSTAKLINTESI